LIVCAENPDSSVEMPEPKLHECDTLSVAFRLLHDHRAAARRKGAMSGRNASRSFYVTGKPGLYWNCRDPRGLMMPLWSHGYRGAPTVVRTAASLLVGRRRSARDRPTFVVDPSPSVGCYVHVAQGTTVLVMPSEGRVLKVVDRAGPGSAAIRNELAAAAFARDLQPQITASGATDAVEWMCSQYIPCRFEIETSQWPKILQASVFASLEKVYRRAGIQSESRNQYRDRLGSEIDASNACESDKNTMAAALQLIGGMEAVPVIYRSYVHGDLHDEHARLMKGSLCLLDWGNSGHRNLFFDLFCPLMYSQPSDSEWLHRPRDGHLDGARAAFCARVEKMLGLQVSPQFYLAHMLGCAVERLLENASRRGSALTARAKQLLQSVNEVVATKKGAG